MNYVNEQNMQEILDGIARKIGQGGSGAGLEDWQASHEYAENDICVYEGQIYRAKVGFTSDTIFSTIEILEEYEPVGGETIIPYEQDTEITTGDIVSHDGTDYEALYNFVCGEEFSLYALEEYVPIELTDDDIKEIVSAYNPEIGANSTSFIVPNRAESHNALFRGDNITDYFNSGQMSEAIANGTFENIFPGDYIVKSITVNGTTYDNVEWVVGDLDYHLHSGDTETTTHHVLLFPRDCIGTSYMNSSNITTGGYVGSYMWATRIPQYVTAIEATFGASHVLQHRELLSTATDTNRSRAYYGWTGASSNWAWTNVKVNIFNEYMIYGSNAVDSSFFDCGDGNTQIAVMRHYKPIIHTRSNWYWLRSVSTSASFAYCTNYGSSNPAGASSVGGVRPYFLFH